ncbi:DNA cytosine methyltransferase [Bacillus sp. FSL K6-0047]
MNVSYRWRLKDLKKVESNGLKVFSTFSCGGGSSMGYKLAGYELLGNCEIDPQMMALYKENIKPKHPFLMDIRRFKNLKSYPKELYDLDILDGSPPCSVFSMSGLREEAWGKEKAFREGQSVQALDDLFFDYLDVVERLKPKVFVAENVTGLIKGSAKGFVKLIKDRANEIGYDVQLFLLNAAKMGVPQRRERVFFVGRKKSLGMNALQLKGIFNQKPIPYGEFRSGKGARLNEQSKTYRRWLKRKPTDKNFGDITKRVEGKQTNFNTILVRDNDVVPTLASGSGFVRFDEPYYISTLDIVHIQSFPIDYDFKDAQPLYVCGMSVPPLMMKGLAEQIAKQMFKK